MKGFIQTLKNIWSLKELKDKILFKTSRRTVRALLNAYGSRTLKLN